VSEFSGFLHGFPALKERNLQQDSEVSISSTLKVSSSFRNAVKSMYLAVRNRNFLGVLKMQGDVTLRMRIAKR
jgi:hypothetical protein